MAKRPRDTCPSCRKEIALKTNGAFRPHTKGRQGRPGYEPICPGANRRPDGTIPTPGYKFMMPPGEAS